MNDNTNDNKNDNMTDLMTGKLDGGEKEEREAELLNELAFDQAVERLCQQITQAHEETPDPAMAIVVDLATTDEAAVKFGWPSAALMKKAVEEAIRLLPEKITDRIELEEI